MMFTIDRLNARKLDFIDLLIYDRLQTRVQQLDNPIYLCKNLKKKNNTRYEYYIVLDESKRSTQSGLVPAKYKYSKRD